MSFDTEALFHQVADLSPTDREEYFVRHAVPDAVRSEVEALLECDGAVAEIANGLAAGVESLIQGVHVQDVQDACGAYSLVRQLGRGGMGAVYLAKRTDGEVEQLAAIKFLRYDSDAPWLKERFLLERQILASLRHAGIAHLIDAGHTSDGHPYLVMEYVDGVPIDEYCKDLSIRAKLELFLQVCEAVDHAHRNLIIHRDLKPSNILVNAAGSVKLLDFGIAKILDAASDRTRTRERMLTPEYASPEQVRGAAQTTATDVYSLGAVLYKLLTGRSPHVFEPGSEDSAEAVICTSTPEPASRLNAEIPRDLDFVLGMALRKEPESRYRGVEALSEDIRAFLQSRPVRARAGNPWYLTRKFLRRYWIPATAAAVAMASLSIGLVAASRERAVAQLRFREVRQLSNKLFDIDARVRRLPGGADTRQFIVDTSLEYLRRLTADVQGDPDLELDLGTAYMRVGRVQGVPISPNLGQSENAERNLRIAEGLIQGVIAAQPSNRTAYLRAAQIAHDRMVLAQALRPDTEAMPLAIQAEEWLNRYLGSGEVDDAEKIQVVVVGMNVANWYVRKERMDEGLRLLRRTIEIAKATNQPAQAGSAQIVTARALRSTGDLEGALVAIGEGVRLMEPPAGSSPIVGSSFDLALATQGEILGEEDAISLGRPGEAAVLFERAMNISANFVRQDASDAESRFAFADDAIKLADVLRHSDARRAVAIYDEALRRLAEIKNNSRARRDEVRALAGSTYPLRQIGRTAEARKGLDAAFSRLSGLKLYPAEQIDPGSEPDRALRALAEYEASMGNVRRAIEIYEELLSKLMASGLRPESNLYHSLSVSMLYEASSVLHRRSGRLDQAGELDARRRDLWRHWDRKLPNNTFIRGQLEASR